MGMTKAFNFIHEIFLFHLLFSFQNYACLTSISENLSVIYQLIMYILVFQGCPHKLPQTLQSKYYKCTLPQLHSSQTRNGIHGLKSRSQQSCGPFSPLQRGVYLLALPGSRSCLPSCGPFYLQNQPPASPVLPTSHLITLIALWLGPFTLLGLCDCIGPPG